MTFRRTRRELLVLAIVAPVFAIGAAAIVTHVKTNVVVSSHRPSVHARLILSSGQALNMFFDGLPPDTKRRDLFRRVVAEHPPRAGCRKPTVMVNTIAFGVVHAQSCSKTGCQVCPFTVVDEIGCYECDGTSSYATQYYEDFGSPFGFNLTGESNCSGRCCIYAECSCGT